MVFWALLSQVGDKLNMHVAWFSLSFVLFILGGHTCRTTKHLCAKLFEEHKCV